jgi:acyl-CoA thioesterase
MVTTSSPAPFDELVTPRAISSGHFQFTIPEGWQQGPSTFGGLVLGGMTRAMEATVSAERTLRSLGAALFGPAATGEAELQVEEMRTGSAVSTVACRLIQGGGVQASAVGVFGRARTLERDRVALEPPPRSDWRSLTPFSGPTEASPWPRFTSMFEYRPSAFPPFRGGADARAEGWIRLKHPGTRRDAAFAIACVDAWWPALFTIERDFRPVTTVAFMFHLCGTLDGLDLEAPLYYRGHAPVIREGYATEFRELWREDGRLVAMNQQTFVIVK